MGLTTELGCVNQTYFLEKATYEQQSLWGFFSRNVVPTQFEDDQIVFLNKGGWRYDLLAGKVQLGDVIGVSPFNDTLFVWEELPSEVISQLKATIYDYVMASAKPFVGNNNSYDLITGSFDLEAIKRALIKIYPEAAEREPVAFNATSTSIWVDFIRDHSPSDIATLPPTKDKTDESPSRDVLNTTNKKKHPSPYPSTSTSDELRLGFVAVAVAVVLLLGSVNVWQRGRHDKC
jgi:hypothetical protein